MACFSTSYADHYYIYMHSQLIVSLDCSIILGLEYAKKATKSLWEHSFFYRVNNFNSLPFVMAALSL